MLADDRQGLGAIGHAHKGQHTGHNVVHSARLVLLVVQIFRGPLPGELGLLTVLRLWRSQRPWIKPARDSRS